MSPLSLVGAVALAAAAQGAPMRAVDEASAAGTWVDSGSDRRQRAVEAFEAGEAAFARADYFEALANFKRAQRLAPTPELHYNIGLCHQRVDNWDRAIESFERYLDAAPDAFDRTDVEARIRGAKRRRSKERRMRLLAKARAASRAGQGEDARPDSSARSRSSLSDGEDATAHRGLIGVGGALLALGAAGATGGGVSTTLMMRRNEDALALAEGEERQALVRDNELLDTARWTSIGAGAAVAVTGAVLLGMGLKRRADARRTALAPYAGPTGAGLQLRGRF